jgi:hypothetical protein
MTTAHDVRVTMRRFPILWASLLLAGAAPPDPGWSERAPLAAQDVASGRPLVTLVIVPLCSNKQIDCGSAIAGRAGDPAHNIYWGAVFGARTIFERKNNGWTRVDRTQGPAPILEQAVYRRTIPAGTWPGAPIAAEQITVLQAFHGDQIDLAVERFWKTATEGGRVGFHDGARERDERVHAVGYAGHNRLMDGLRLPAAADAAHRNPTPAFVLACRSEPYFGPALRAAGVPVLLTTREFMAPEGYLVESVVRSIGAGRGTRAIRNAAVDSLVSWARIERKHAAWVFSPP